MNARVPNLGRTIRNINRAREILTVFAGFGFEDVIQDLEIDRLVLKGRRLIGLSKPDATVSREPQAVRLREAMEELGPTFIKMAQVLSTRPDLIPESWAAEFEKLQSDVPPADADEVRAHLESEFADALDDHFASVETEPFAAASIAQAHRATLHNGTEVVLKVRRPGIADVIDADLEILHTLASFIESRFEDLGYSPKQVVDQFERQIRRELDLSLERRSMARMARAFEGDDRLVFPKTYPEHSTKAVLCMEHIDGVLLADRADAGFSDAEREAIVSIGSDAVFRQCFEIGFFHADPHPGNMFVVRPPDDAPDDAPPVRLCFIDYGMTGHIDPRTAEQLADLVQGTIQGELDRVIEVVIELTGVTPLIARDRAFRADVWEFISRFQTESLKDLQMGALLREFFAKVRRHKLRVPADIVYLIKSVTTIEGVGEAVCPEFDLIGHVQPHVENLVKRRYGFGALRRRVQGTTIAYAELLERAPRELRDLVHLLRDERITVNLAHQGIGELTHEIEQASRNISYALVLASLIVGGAIMMLADTAGGGGRGLLFYLGVGAIVLAAVAGVARVLFRQNIWERIGVTSSSRRRGR
ncbi:MAG: AarF/UbiB family protein [Phycisphaerales bacterium]